MVNHQEIISSINTFIQSLAKDIDKFFRYLPIINIPYYIVRDFFVLGADQEEFKDFIIFTGMKGRGKTKSLVRTAFEYRKKYGNSIYIIANFRTPLRDEYLSSFHQFLQEYDKPVLFLVDEVHLQFRATEWAKMPTSALDVFSLGRKTKKKLMGTAQKYNRMYNIIREYTDYVVECRTYFRRFTFLDYYSNEDYETLLSMRKSALNKRQYPKPIKREFYIGHNELHDLYDTDEVIQALNLDDKPFSKKLDSNIPMIEKI